MEKSKILTIAIPTFNRADKLRQCVEHILSDIPEEVAILIYDNCSPDNTPRVCAELGKNPAVTYRRNVANLGAGRNIFQCLLNSNTNYVMLLGDDDKLDLKYLRSVAVSLRSKNFAILTYQSGARTENLQEISAGEDACAAVYLRTGSLAGNVFNRNFLNLAETPPLDNAIYQQIAMALHAACRGPIGVLHCQHVVDLDFFNNLTIEQISSGRPPDYGVGERISYLHQLYVNGKMRKSVYESCISSLMIWVLAVWDLKSQADPISARAFSIVLIKNKILFKSQAFKRCFFWPMIKSTRMKIIDRIVCLRTYFWRTLLQMLN